MSMNRKGRKEKYISQLQHQRISAITSLWCEKRERKEQRPETGTRFPRLFPTHSFHSLIQQTNRHTGQQAVRDRDEKMQPKIHLISSSSSRRVVALGS